MVTFDRQKGLEKANLAEVQLQKNILNSTEDDWRKPVSLCKPDLVSNGTHT